MAQDPVDIGTVANDGTGDTLRVAFAKLNANDAELYALVADVSADTPAELLAKLLTVDGAGSGLDADLLDGQSSAAFAAAVHAHAIADVTGLQAALDAKLPSASYTAADVLSKLLTVDGAGSGIDADLLDGQSSAAFAAAAHSHAISDVTGLQAALDGKGDLASSVSVSVDSEVMLFSGTTGKVAKRATGSGLATLVAGVLSITDPLTFAAAAHTHAIADTTGLQAALDAKLPSAQYNAADVLTKLLTVDGEDSGLDADLLDGLSAADFAAAAHTHAQSDITGLAAALAAKLDASAYTAADVLSKLLTVDGAGSGLDADTLDGVSSAGFAAASHSHAISDVTGLQAALDAKLASASYTAADVLAKLLTVDGTGSGLDADLLDGQSAAAFAAAAHTHAIADTTGLQAALDAKLNASAYTAADVLTKLLTVDGTGSGVDADLLDGLDSTAFARRTIAQTISGSWDFTGTQYFKATAANVALIANLVDGGTGIMAHQEVRCHRVAAEPFWVSLRINGSYASPTGVLNGHSLGEFTFGGYNGATIQAQSTRLFCSATEDWSSTALGADVFVHTTTAGTTTRATRMRLGGNSTGGYAQFPSGTAGQPGIGFAADTDNGLYLSTTNEVSVTTAGTQRIQINATSVNFAPVLRAPDGTLGAPAVSFSSATTTGLHLSAANEITLGTANVRRVVFDASGRTLFGGLSTSTQIGSLAGLTMQCASGSNTGFSIARFSNDTTAPVFVMGKSRDTTIGGATAVQSGDNLARWQFSGADGTDVQTLAAGMYVVVAGAVSTDVVPGEMQFYTSTTAGVFTESMRITAGGTTLFRAGSAALPSISLLADPDTGIYSIAANQLGVSAGGTLVLDISTALFAITATTIRFNTTTATTVGAAGAAAALPAQPLGYITANVGGTAAKIPYYNV